MIETLKIVLGLMVVAAFLGGCVICLMLAGSFINRIGNPYDKW